MKYFNQNNYRNVPYPSKTLPKATVASGGCGVVSAAMIVSNLTGQVVTPDKMASYAMNKGARVVGGTDMLTLAKALVIDYPLDYLTTNDENKLLQHLKSGGMAIANVGGNRPGYTGVFSDGGHFIVVAGISQNGKVIVLDPGYYPGKFNKPGRIGKVTVVDGYQCICDMVVLAKDTENRSPAYYLFSRRGVEQVEWKIKLMNEAAEIGLIDPKAGHKPDDLATKWFVLAVCVNLYKKLIGGK